MAEPQSFVVQPKWCGTEYMVCNRVMGRIEYRPHSGIDYFRAFSLAASNQPCWIGDYGSPTEARAAVEATALKALKGDADE
jgi:hypothetical protein